MGKRVSKLLVQDSGINPEIISGILNFRDLDFRDSGLLKLPGLGFSGFRIPELQDFLGLQVFWDPETLPIPDSRVISLVEQYFPLLITLIFALISLNVPILRNITIGHISC